MRSEASYQAKSKPRAAGTRAAVLFADWLASNGTIVARIETPARRSSRVISVRRFEFFQPIAVLAAARYCGAATTYSLLSPKSREPRNTPNTRKDDITGGGFVSVCSVCSVVKKNGIAAQPKITCWSGFASPSASHYNQVGGKANDTRASTV